MHLIFRLLALISIIFIVGSEAKADTASAKSAWDKAYNDFYEAIRPLSNPSPDQINELNKKILVPANENYIQEKHAEHLKNNPVSTGKETHPRKRMKPKTRPDLLNGLSGKPTTAAAPSPYPSAPKYNVQPRRSRDEVILDGKDIPKEIEFKPAKKSKK